MSKKEDYIRCVYCGTKNVKSTKVNSSKDTLNLKVYSSESATSVSSPQLVINCPLCEKKYIGIFLTHGIFLKNHIEFSDISLGDLKRLFPKLRSPQRVLDKVTGIARLIKKMQTFRPKEYDICFKFERKFTYLHCNKKKTLFRVLSVNEV